MGKAFAIAENGYTDLPAGKIASIVTFLEMRRAHLPLTSPARPDLKLVRLAGQDHRRYRAIYRLLGERWLWWSRLELSDAALAALLDAPQIEAYALVCRGEDIGLLELDFRDPSGAELAFFGVIEAMIGSGCGRWLIDRAIESAFARKPPRLFVHTCTFDHPNALGFYRRAGFVAYKFALEVTDDPRLTGVLPRSAAPHVPLIEIRATSTLTR